MSRWKDIMVPTSACLLFIGMIKHHDQKQDGAQRIYFIYILQSQTITKGSQGKNWNRDHRGTVYWPALSSSTNSQPIGLWSNRKYSPSGTKLCPSLLSLAVIRLWPNAALTAQLFIHSNHWKKSEKELVSRNWSKTPCCSVVCLPCFLEEINSTPGYRSGTSASWAFSHQS